MTIEMNSFFLVCCCCCGGWVVWHGWYSRLWFVFLIVEYWVEAFVDEDIDVDLDTGVESIVAVDML